jgi:pimeloyl-ACP methyl ester carboxylesterase
MFVTINGCKIFFDVYGSKLNIIPTSIKEKPTLIVLHGGHGMVDHTLYVEFWSKFSDICQVIFLDQRGAGRSDWCTSEEWDLAHWADDLFQFCQTLGIEKPILAGVSMGGYVMCEYIKKHSKEVSGLVFCNTEARFILDDVCQKLAELGGETIGEIARTQFTAPTKESAQQYQQLCVPYYARNAYSPFEVARCKQNIAVLSHFYKCQIQNFDYLEDLKQVRCPTLLMVGEQSPLHLPARAQEMAKKIPPELLTYHFFRNAGAPVYKDSPEESFEVIREFFLKNY